MKVVYLKLVRNTPFYVGEGTERRAGDDSARNKLFKDVRGDQHMCSLVVSTHHDKVGAVLQEQGFIRWFGQRITGEGPLTNILPWGDVSSGTFHPLAPENFDAERERLRSERVSKTRLEKTASGELIHGTWFNNGTEETNIHPPPEGWVPGRLYKTSDETKKLQRQSKLGRHWWNDGKTSRIARECPGPGFIPGRLPKKTEGDGR